MKLPIVFNCLVYFLFAVMSILAHDDNDHASNGQCHGELRNEIHPNNPPKQAALIEGGVGRP